jgi:hypothetical protein
MEAKTMTEKKEEEGKKGRALMPVVASIVDELRAAYGAARVNAAIAAGQQARREYLARVASDGPTLANRWLAAQKFPAGCFWAEEGGKEVGVQR